MPDDPKELTPEELQKLDLEVKHRQLNEGGWFLQENRRWQHPRWQQSYHLEQALEVNALMDCHYRLARDRDTLVETLKQIPWHDWEKNLDYFVFTRPLSLLPDIEDLPDAKAASFKKLIEVLKAVFTAIEDKEKEKEKGNLVYSYVRKQYDKVTHPDGTVAHVSDFYINTLFQWNGERWESVFGNTQVPR